jgi:hypothetical protein
MLGVYIELSLRFNESTDLVYTVSTQRLVRIGIWTIRIMY